MHKNIDEMLSHLQEPVPSTAAKEHALNSAMAAFDKKSATPRAQTASFYLIPELLGGASVVIIVLAVFNMLSGSAADLPKMVETVAYVVGLYLAVSGIFKLGNAYIYFATSVGLLALPYLTLGMAGSINNGGGNVGYAEGVFNAPMFSAPSPQTYIGISHAAKTFGPNPLASNAAVLCIGLFLAVAAWMVYSRLKKRKFKGGK